jgi:hypothetical protein
LAKGTEPELLPLRFFVSNLLMNKINNNPLLRPVLFLASAKRLLELILINSLSGRHGFHTVALYLNDDYDLQAMH